MKRIDVIKKQLTELIGDCYIGNCESMLLELAEVETFNRYVSGILNNYFEEESKKEISKNFNDVEHCIMFIQWLNEEVRTPY